ncbi:MAG: TonB-dependent receptor [Candidatus Omnitrophica bacterium]|nr:TonB-dependent receptor [Candidatus Omnitrophota bacterium]
MLNFIKRCGLLFIYTFAYLEPAFCKSRSVDLERIVITKTNAHPLDVYALELDEVGILGSFIESLTALGFLDLQSRNLKAGIQTDFSLRGSNFQGVLILLDGQRINDPQTAHHNADIPITIEDIERIELIPGAGSSLFGPDAIGGAINLILKKPKEKKMTLKTSFGSYQTKSNLFSFTEKKDDLGIRFSLERTESDGFRYDTDFREFISRFDSSLGLPDGEFNLGWGYQEKEFGAYNFYTPGLDYPSKEWTKTFCLNTGLNLNKEGFLIKPNFLWRRHYDKFTLDKRRLDWYLNHHCTDVYTPTIYMEKETEDLGRWGWGLEYGQERINSTKLGKHNRSHRSIFLDHSKDLDGSIFWGLSFRFDDFDGFANIYTGLANLRFKPNEFNSLHLGISKSMRVPSFTELSYNDPTTEGTPGLLPERSLAYQIGYDYREEKIMLGSTFFLRKEKDFIDWIKHTPSQNKWQAENITEAEVFGVETFLNFKINPNLSLESNYTYIHRHLASRSYLYKYGPNYIQHLFNTSFNFDFALLKQRVNFHYKKRPHRHGWLLNNIIFSFNLNKLNKNATVFLKIDNLFNVEYQDIEGIPQPGRWFETELRFEW